MVTWGRVTPSTLVVLAVTAIIGCGSGESTDPVGDTTEPVSPAGAATSGDTADVEVVGIAPPPDEGSPSVIILEPHAPSDVPIPTEPAEMDQFGRDFIPRLLLVRQGQPVVFLNSEDDLHTVHVSDEDGTSLFNVAMPIRGGRHDHTFTELGDYAISCDAHQEMSATIIVLDTPYAVIADRDGAFAIPDVPAGTYTVILRRNTQRHEQVVEVEPGRNELTLAFPASS